MVNRGVGPNLLPAPFQDGGDLHWVSGSRRVNVRPEGKETSLGGRQESLRPGKETLVGPLRDTSPAFLGGWEGLLKQLCGVLLHSSSGGVVRGGE